MPLAHEVDVDDIRLAEEEGDGRKGPRDQEPHRRRRQFAHERQIEDRGDCGDDDRETTDTDGGGQPRRCDESPALRGTGTFARRLGVVLARGSRHRDLATGLLPSGARPVSGRRCGDALARKSYARQDLHEKSGPEGPLFMSATWTANGPAGLSPSDDPQAGPVAVSRFGNWR